MDSTKKLIFVLAIAIFLSGVVAKAVELDLAFPLPRACPIEGACPSPEDEVQNISAYIVRIYQFGVGIAGILAVGMIVFGAIYYTVSAGSPDKQNEGKEYITSALWGLALLLGSYLILNTINPQIIRLKDPEAPPASIQSLNLGGATSTCPNNGRSCFIDPTQATSSPSYNCTPNIGIVCNAINNETPACTSLPRPGNINCVGLNNTPLLPVGLNALNEIPIKPGACSPNLGSGVCLLKENVAEALKEFLGDAQRRAPVSNPAFGGIGIGGVWRVTEAFPPTAEHASACHYNGGCFDFAPAPTPNTAGLCRQFQAVIDAANNYFNTVIIESASEVIETCKDLEVTINPGSALVKTFRTTTAFHIHLSSPK